MQQEKWNTGQCVPLLHLILRKQLALAVLNDGTAGDDTDEGILVINHRNKILCAGSGHQVVHGGGHPNGDIILASGYLHDPMGLRLPHVHVAKVLQRPQKISFRQGSPVLAPLVQDRQCREAGGFHLLKSLSQREIII